MMVMPATHSSPTFHYWAGKGHPVGWLVGPSSWSKTKIRDWVPYALDNDAFSAWRDKKEWDEKAFFRMLDYASRKEHKPLWVLVPDVVADKNKTLESWYHHFPRIQKYGFPLAFAVQDGMTPADVPADAEVVFVGGTTEWKWRNAKWFCENHSRVHVGRVNTPDRLWICSDMGAESVDGTGWFRCGSESHHLLRLGEFFEGKREMQLFETSIA